MKFGLHYLLSCAETQSPVQRYRETLEQAVRGEALGFESVWPVEQHFLPVVSILPSPAVLLGAIASRTRTLRLGTAIVQLPLNHPIRLAEDISTLDVISSGRVELGVGRGANPVHYAGLGVPAAESRDRMVEALALVRRAWTEEKVTFQGRFFQVEGVSLSPRPVQRPHPPIRIAANSPETIDFAGRAGYPIIFASNIHPLPRLRELVPRYRQARADAGHPPASPDDVTLLMPLFVGESRDQVRRLVEPSVKNAAFIAASALAPAVESAPPEERQKLAPIVDRLRQLTYEQVEDAMGFFGTPEGCVDRLRELEADLGVGRVITWFNFGGMVPHDDVIRSMELFSSKVIPAL